MKNYIYITISDELRRASDNVEEAVIQANDVSLEEDLETYLLVVNDEGIVEETLYMNMLGDTNSIDTYVDYKLSDLGKIPG